MTMNEIFRLAGWVILGILVTVFIFTGVETASEGRFFLGTLQLGGALFLLSVPARRIVQS